MDAQRRQPPRSHQTVLERFVAACREDPRVVAAFLGGSYARDAADAYSDLDLYVVTADEAHDDFVADRAALLGRLGEPFFMQDHTGRYGHFVFFTLADGTDGELGLGRASHFRHMHVGPYRVLLDNQGILDGVEFPPIDTPLDEQVAALRNSIAWFWHDLSHHFITSMARGRLWSAYGALEDLRRACVNLARLDANIGVEAEGYEKVEEAVPAERLAALGASCCPLERDAMLRAARVIVRFYEEIAPRLARTHDIPYSQEYARMIAERLVRFCEASAS